MDRFLSATLALFSIACSSAGLVPTHYPALRDADAIVVLGNRPPVDAEGRIRDELRRRLDRGIELFRQGRAPQLLVTGGADGRGHVEAEVMRRYAVAEGVPGEAVLVEDRSTDTIENAGFSVAMLCRGSGRPCVPRVILVTTPHHLGRARDLFECAGAEVQLAPAPMPGAEGSPVRRRHVRAAIVRERFVRLAYGGIDVCEHVRAARTSALE